MSATTADQESTLQQHQDDEIEPNATFVHCTSVYVKNLEEKIKIPDLIESLRGIFSEYGTIIDIIAKKSIKRRGQAFVVFDNVDSAQNAIDELSGFEFAGKQMNCEFAKTKSDATVKREGTEEDLDEHVRIRKEVKERKQAAEKAEQEKNKKRPAQETAVSNRPKAPRAGAAQDDDAEKSNVLIVQGIPEGYDETAMSAIFGRIPGFKEYLPVPHRNGLGFVHYDTVDGAAAAKAQLSSIKLGGSEITITYRQA
ncbi:RNA-binding domain-containing protein [Myriangium duriaei CBS 260.36]|uniref:RNA-binding domain-containing protein n=1 Tax=Myriangium duriaei CBS 260.36 TaxID=1168546 RepID=A0A9P4MDI1_9PEZI|nr:RNA-binding domain-containing protein [Myriangium duriaei CBS 260.36]